MKPAILYKKNDDDSVNCLLCSHYCEIMTGKSGTCMTRTNIDGELFTYSYGAPSGFAIDPIEKKPFFNFKPGTKVLSFGTPGCNFKCRNCQNWNLSFAKKSEIRSLASVVSPAEIADLAVQNKVDGIAYTYSEPTIFFEFARDTILECRKKEQSKNLFHVFVSNGYMSKEAINLINREMLISAINIDLKFMDNEKYKRICGATLQPVLDNIKRFSDLSETIHMEIINLVIPDENDTTEDFEKLSEFIVSVNPEIPLHFSRFFPTNKMTDKKPTAIDKLNKAKSIAEEAGIHYVYIGNTDIPGMEDTNCPLCKQTIISRNRYSSIFAIPYQKLNKCPNCEHKVNIRL